MNGFFSPFKLPNEKYCPHCCNEISQEEYHNWCTFSLGCSNCRNEHENEIYQRWFTKYEDAEEFMNEDIFYIKQKMNTI